jgi:hypothetical protein
MAYIGREPQFGAFETQNLVGNGSDTQFTLDFPTTTTSSIAVWVNKVSQVPEVDYNVTTSTIQFTVAPGNGVQIKILYLGRQHLVGEVANNSITSSKIDIFKDTPNASSIYEINDSTTNGVLIAPKMTETQRDAISSPATSLVIYNTTTNKLNIYNGTSWEGLGSSSMASNAMNLSESNASDIFTNFVKDMEDHGRTALNTEKGFVDELEASDDMIDTGVTGLIYNPTDDLYTSNLGPNNDSSKTYTTESNYIQQEWTNSNQSTSQATVSGTTVTLSSGTWPTNCVNARISFDSGSTFENITSRDSGTQITLDSAGTNATSDYILRMSEFDAGVVQLNSYMVNSFGPDLTSTSFALASSGNRGGHSTTGAVDNSTTVTWADNKGSNLWWSIDFGSGVTKRIQKYTLVGKYSAGNPSGNDTMRDWKLEGSNDNTNWTTVDTRTGTTTWVDQAKTDYTSMNGTVGDFRHYRIFITANNSGNAICGIVELELMELSNPQASNPTTEYVSIADTYSNKTDISFWSDINSNSITENLNSQNTYYWYSFDPTNNYGPDTEVKIFHQGGSVWRTIAKNNAGTWEYNSSTTAATFTGTSATTNDMLHAVSQALSTVSDNRMTKAEIEAITDAEFEATGGFSTSNNLLVRGFTLVSSSATQTPEVDLFTINYDATGGSSAVELRTKQWTGTGGTPSAPATSPDTIYLFVVDEQTSGTPVYAVTRDGGTTYTNTTFNASWVFNGTKVARRATIDVSGQPLGTDPRLKITGSAGINFTLHAVGLQTK